MEGLNMYKNTKKTILSLFIIFLFLGCSDKLETNVSVVKADLEYLEDLITQKITVADILKAEHQNKYAGESVLSWTIEGTALISVNLNEMKLHQHKESKLLTITLPEPKISNFKLNQKKTETFKVKKGFFADAKVISFIRNESMKQAEDALTYKIENMNYKKDSKDAAEKTLSIFFTKQKGFSNIEFKWKKSDVK